MSRVMFAVFAFMAMVAVGSAVEVTYSGNAAVDFNGTYFGGAADGTPAFFSMTVFTPVVEEPVVKEPVVEEPTYDNEVVSAGFGTAPSGDSAYVVVYTDGPVVFVYGYDEDGRMRMGAQDMPPFGTYYEQAVEMYTAFVGQ